MNPRWVCVYPDGKFVHEDASSGGYPTPADWWWATFFASESDAAKYAEVCRNEKLRVFRVELLVYPVGVGAGRVQHPVVVEREKHDG